MDNLTSEYLAKLLAEENILVEFYNSPTAMFDVEQRIMYLPTFNDKLSKDAKELLIIHEISHALNTPSLGRHTEIRENSKIYASIVNIVEDKRIEDLIKKKYPGSKRVFVDGFNDMIECGFFGITETEDCTLNGNMGFLDRINLKMKGNNKFYVTFTEKEQKIVDQMYDMKTFDDVISISNQIYSFMKENLSQELEHNIQKLEMKDLLDSTLADLLNTDKMKPDLNDLSQEGQQKTITEQTLKETLKEKLENGDITQEQIDDLLEKIGQNSKTDNSFQESVGNFLSNTQIRNIRIPDFEYDKIVVSNQEIHTIISESNSSFHNEVSSVFYDDFVKKQKPSVSMMAKEFDMKKTAKQYLNSHIAKTGTLNPNKLFAYKTQENIFLNKEIKRNTKNHGLLIMLDWSYSMDNILKPSMEQIITLSLFCKRVGIPIEVYAFSNPSNFKRNDSSESNLLLTTKNIKKNEAIVSKDFRLLHLISSKSDIKMEQQLKNVLSLSVALELESHHGLDAIVEYAKQRFEISQKNETQLSFVRNHIDQIKIPSPLTLNGTPLNEAVLVLPSVLEHFKKTHHSEIINTIFITDGDANGTVYVSKIPLKKETVLDFNDPQQCETFNSCFFRNEFTIIHHKNRSFKVKIDRPNEITMSLLGILGGVLDTKILGYHLTNLREAERILERVKEPYEIIEKKKRNFSKHNFLTTNKNGYYKQYIIKNASLKIQDFDDDTDILQKKIENLKTDKPTQKQFTKIFSSTQKEMITNKIFLTNFIEEISTNI